MMRILVIDVGGTNVKVIMTGRREPIKIPSGKHMTARAMVKAVKEATKDWTYDAVSIGYPGPAANGRIMAEPKNLARGWVGFDFQKAFGKPVKIINDAAMQALGSYEGGRMLFLGLGTGLGTTLIIDGVVAPMELAHLPFKKGRTYEEYLGQAALNKRGKKRWKRHVFEVVAMLKAALVADTVVLGGGNTRLIEKLPAGIRRGTNDRAFAGGYRLWNPDARRARR